MEPTKHKGRAHALLSASGASKWLNCTPSARLEETFPDSPTSVYAEEGTLAHELSEVYLKAALTSDAADADDIAATLVRIEDHELFTPDMPEEVAKYTDYVLEQFQAAKTKTPGAVLLIEQKIDLTAYIEEGFGSVDAIIIADGTMEVIDLKYGKGVQVDATNNTQLQLYGLGALEKYFLLYDINNVMLTIIQPRINNYSSFTLSADELLAWATNVVVPKALLAYAGEGPFQPGTHCRWCKAAPKCRALAEFNLTLARQDFEAESTFTSEDLTQPPSPDLLSDEELSNIFKHFPIFESWLSSISSHMLRQAIAGHSYPDLKLVEGRSQRKWSDETQALRTLLAKGYEPDDITTTKIKGITEIQKLLKKEFDSTLGPYLDKPPGKPALVPVSDKRPEMKSVDSAVLDFADDEGDI